MQIVLLIGLGGFFGTIARYLIGNVFTHYNKPQFPFATLTVNLLGCFIIGLIYGWFEKQQLDSTDWKLILTAGFCGGFTTFSAFSMENLQLMRDGQTLMAILYIFSSLLFGLLLTWLGMSLSRT